MSLRVAVKQERFGHSFTLLSTHMKTACTRSLVAAAFALSACLGLTGCQEQQLVAPQVAAVKSSADIIFFHFSIKPYQPSSGCRSNWGLCGGRLILFGWVVFRPAEPGGYNDVQGYVEELSEDKGQLTFFFQYKEDANRPGERVITVKEPEATTEEFAKGIGAYSELTILPGSYKFDESLGEYGGFKLDVQYKK